MVALSLRSGIGSGLLGRGLLPVGGRGLVVRIVGSRCGFFGQDRLEVGAGLGVELVKIFV